MKLPAGPIGSITLLCVLGTSVNHAVAAPSTFGAPSRAMPRVIVFKGTAAKARRGSPMSLLPQASLVSRATAPAPLSPSKLGQALASAGISVPSSMLGQSNFTLTPVLPRVANHGYLRFMGAWESKFGPQDNPSCAYLFLPQKDDQEPRLLQFNVLQSALTSGKTYLVDFEVWGEGTWQVEGPDGTQEVTPGGGAQHLLVLLPSQQFGGVEEGEVPAGHGFTITIKNRDEMWVFYSVAMTELP